MQHDLGAPQLSLADFAQLLSGAARPMLSAETIGRMQQCRSYLDARLESKDDMLYGINTGFGSLCNTRISHDALHQLQFNLIRSHACGMGDPVPAQVVALMMLLKVRSLALGYSGVRPALAQRLLELWQRKLLPVIYTQGSLGASGDLAPLAHLSLPLIGEGEIWEGGKAVPAGDVLQRQGLNVLDLEAKEGLALLNGTQFMSAYGVFILIEARRLAAWADTVAALSIDAFDARMDPFHPALHAIRPHAGQLKTAHNIRFLLEDSSLSQQPKPHVQDPYSFRCIPQVHGASRDALAYAEGVFETEINSVTDNPNIFFEENLILSGGNFHGQPLALALDFMAIALAEWASISERRSYQLISGSRGLTPFLASDPGLDSGLMIPQYLAAGLVSQNKQLCTPCSVDSIPSSNNQEDHVSMGANAAVKCLSVLNNAWRVLGVELLTASQALKLREPGLSSERLQEVLAQFRKVVPPLTGDRYLHPDLVAATDFLRQNPAPLPEFEPQQAG